MAALPVPRTKFPFPSQLPASWYIGHMSRAVRAINDKMSSIDLVLEARDARIPLTSVNPMFERLVSEKNIPRLVIYNKRDLAEERFEEVQSRLFVSAFEHISSGHCGGHSGNSPFIFQPIRSALKKLAGHETLFLDSRSDSQVKRLLKSIASEQTGENSARLPCCMSLKSLALVRLQAMLGSPQAMLQTSSLSGCQTLESRPY